MPDVSLFQRSVSRLRRPSRSGAAYQPRRGRRESEDAGIERGCSGCRRAARRRRERMGTDGRLDDGASIPARCSSTHTSTPTRSKRLLAHLVSFCTATTGAPSRRVPAGCSRSIWMGKHLPPLPRIEFAVTSSRNCPFLNFWCLRG
jgi:hypothetical protein